MPRRLQQRGFTCRIHLERNSRGLPHAKGGALHIIPSSSENVSLAGVPVPKIIKQALDILKKKGECTDTDEPEKDEEN